jgi:hypothetical protein
VRANLKQPNLKRANLKQPNLVRANLKQPAMKLLNPKRASRKPPAREWLLLAGWARSRHLGLRRWAFVAREPAWALAQPTAPDRVLSIYSLIPLEAIPRRLQKGRKSRSEAPSRIVFPAGPVLIREEPVLVREKKDRRPFPEVKWHQWRASQ